MPTATVLIVESAYLIALDLCQQLEDFGYACHIEGTIDGALRFLERETPRFALIEHELMGSVATPVAERLADLGVPFCVSSAAQPDELFGIFAARPLLPKPHSLKNLKGVLAMLGGRRAEL